MGTLRADASSAVDRRRAEMLWRFCVVAAADAGARAGESAADMCARRNRAARELGFQSYWSLWLDVEELASVQVDEWLDPATRIYAATSDAPSVDADGVVDAARQLGATSGLRVDLVASAVARTYLVDPPRDVRVVSTRPGSARAMRAFAHELGHAVYACNHAPELPWSLADAPTRWMHEGFAEHVADRLVGRVGVDAGYWRWLQICARFERDAYEGRFSDADGHWRDVHRTYDAGEPTRSWRDIDHFRVDPGPRYLAAEALRAELDTKLGGSGFDPVRAMMAAGASTGAEQILQAVRA